ncbi:inhibitor of Bruton tyrosine kinase isoform X1 [Megalops cyprinoides]|uniref:inhibitor of Bruton tyrosine kinase isoform X1 n=1 Tax=Megalops cyprinoides TaxID=118141 RepID=UPI0018651939|nr:inhibitor of Bruton tyrosine kinase isoform X1 [Megalops cyprinoides]
MSAATPECTPKCRSLVHADEVLAAMTAGSEGQLRAFLSGHCCNASTLRDEHGRTALHLAASLGKRALLEWLLDSKSADLLVKDKESGWTALHRSIFYGHIHCLISLAKHGGSLTTQDKEGLTVLDLAMKDRPAHVVFRNSDPTEVYTWGNNANFSLGHGNQESRQHPEIVDLFARTGVYIKQVVLSKFHSVFLSQKGQVFTCGHGQGGRLGHGDEQTYLVPRVVEGLLSHQCSQVAAAKDHTVVLTEEGYVYTFGLNTFHQLGLVPPPASTHLPKQVSSKCLKGRTVIGVAAGRFHTVLWTREAVYTMGLNGGQLGYLLDPNGVKCVTAPRQVSALHHKEVTISMAAASNGATVCVTEKGDVYLLADYQCKKLASRQLNIKKVVVSGGSLDHRMAPQVLNEAGGEKVSILALDQAGRVFSWKAAGSSVKQCRWAYGRQVFMSDIALSKNHMMFVTQEGEGFSGQWLSEHKKGGDKKDAGGGVELTGHSEVSGAYERIRLERLPYVHRAVSITMDSKGRNFGVLQSDPKTSLFEVPSVSPSSFSQHFLNLLSSADEMDSIHDVTLQAGTRTFPAHKYVLSMRSDFFRKQLYPTTEGGRPEEEEEEEGVRKSEDVAGCDLLVLEKIPAEMLEHTLRFVYADSCELLVHGSRPGPPPPQDPALSGLHDLSLPEGLRGRSALEVYRSLPAAQNKSTKTSKKNKGGGAGELAPNPVKTLQGVAKKLGVGSLSARLDGVKYENGKISVVHKKSGNKPKFSQKKCSYLCDVTLKSEDGKEFACHKCVLCARLEYFNSMLGNSWIEATSCTALEMPTSAAVLQVILDYVYTDESIAVKECENVEFVCNVLVVADQLLITRLKEMCEVAITENLTLKNAAELLEFAVMYNAEQLKLSCQQFIVLNIAALLESRALEVLSEEVLLELSAAYRSMIPAMKKRVITPSPVAPDLSGYEDKDWDSSLSTKNESELDSTSRETLLKKAKMKAKRKPRRRSDSSGGYNLSDIIQSPPTTGLVKSGKTGSMESLQELLTSDSEGSYAGVGSPRDLHSPIFQERAELEERSRILSQKSPPQTPPAGIRPPLLANSSTPQPIPRPQMNPTRPPPVLYLRDIMETESQNLGATPKSPVSSSKTSPFPAKLSQKQRKMIAMVTKEGGPEGFPAVSPPVVTPSKNGKAWATPLQSPLSSQSFRDLLEEEERRVKAAAVPVIASGRTAAVPQISAGRTATAPVTSPGALPCTPRRVTFKCAESNDLEKPAGPWLVAAVGSPPAGAMVTFASIVEEERQQEAALIRSREKPLALIQIEERAIQDLLVHYRASNNPDELIVVERAAQGPIAVPTWHKH